MTNIDHSEKLGKLLSAAQGPGVGPTPPKTGFPRAQDVRSLWEQYEDIRLKLAEVGTKCLRTADDFQNSLMEIERLLGVMKRDS